MCWGDCVHIKRGPSPWGRRYGISGNGEQKGKEQIAQVLLKMLTVCSLLSPLLWFQSLTVGQHFYIFPGHLLWAVPAMHGDDDRNGVPAFGASYPRDRWGGNGVWTQLRPVFHRLKEMSSILVIRICGNSLANRKCLETQLPGCCHILVCKQLILDALLKNKEFLQ